MDKNDLLQFAAEEADHRALRYKEVEIVDYVPSDPGGLTLCSAGSVTLFFARGDSDVIRQIREAAVSRSANDRALASEIRSQYDGRKPLSPNDAWRLLRRQPVFADVRSGCRQLATNLFLPKGLDIGVVPFPHNGGRLPAGTLTLVEHRVEDTEEGFDAIALRFPGPLTRAEVSALEQVPDDQLELNIAPYAGCCMDYTGVAILVLMTLVLAKEREIESLSDDVINRLSPGATARELMEIRREALGHHH